MAAPRPQASETPFVRLRHGLRRLHVRGRLTRMQLAALTPTTRGILWALGAGLAFSFANGSMRALSQAIDPLQAQFLRYFVGMLPLLPLLMRTPARSPCSSAYQTSLTLARTRVPRRCAC
jgi:drug/metabolite transporter (DMT)-like permease